MVFAGLGHHAHGSLLIEIVVGWSDVSLEWIFRPRSPLLGRPLGPSAMLAGSGCNDSFLPSLLSAVHLHVTFRGQPLEVVQQIRYLGVMFSFSLVLATPFPTSKAAYSFWVNAPLAIWSPPRRGKTWGVWSLILWPYNKLKSATSVGLLKRLFLARVVPTCTAGLICVQDLGRTCISPISL
jgi:hypothetical protein